jgi:hypothetical protein
MSEVLDSITAMQKTKEQQQNWWCSAWWCTILIPALKFGRLRQED